jgi:hypothetical protein
VQAGELKRVWRAQKKAALRRALNAAKYFCETPASRMEVLRVYADQ